MSELDILGPAAGAGSGQAADADNRPGPSLGKRLKIRSMVNVAGEVLPFFWPMRNFIHHNPLHGLEHLPFEQAVAEATGLFHARGYLRRVDYQRLMARGSIDVEELQSQVETFVTDWLAEQGSSDEDVRDLLYRSLVAMVTGMDQPAPGVDVPCSEEVMAALRRLAD